MNTANDLWGRLGELPEEEHIHLLTKLFDAYEAKRRSERPTTLACWNFSDTSATLSNKQQAAI